MQLPPQLETNYDNLGINDFIVHIRYVADKQESHPAFAGVLPEYVSAAPVLREFGDSLGKARDAAAGGDKGFVAAFKSLWNLAKRALHMNALHVTMLSVHRNDPKLLDDAGYDHKQKVTKPVLNLLETAPEVFVRHRVPPSGSIAINVKRAKPGVAIGVQITYGDPKDESSWLQEQMYNQSRIEYKGLEVQKLVHIRARYHENGVAGPWSAYTFIIII